MAWQCVSREEEVVVENLKSEQTAEMEPFEALAHISFTQI